MLTTDQVAAVFNVHASCLVLVHDIFSCLVVLYMFFFAFYIEIILQHCKIDFVKFMPFKFLVYDLYVYMFPQAIKNLVPGRELNY